MKRVVLLALAIACGAASAIDCKVVYEGHLPKISIDGKKFAPEFRLTNYDYRTDPTYDNQALRHMAKAGLKIFRMDCDIDDGYLDDGKYDFSILDEKARHILAQVPEAYLELTVRYNMSKWCAKHPEEIIQFAGGKADPKYPGDECTGRPIRPSAASDAFHREAIRGTDALCAKVAKAKWGERVAAVRVAWGIYTEWHTFGMYEAPDTGIRMTQLFRAYLERKYGKGAGEGAEVPSAGERGKGMTLLDPVKDRRLMDYYDCHSNAASDFLLRLAREYKCRLPGRLVGAYYGYIITAHPPEGANAQLHKVLAAKEIDFLSCPPIYSGETRLAGGSNMSRSIPSTFHRYGKLMMSEDDSRFHHIKGYAEANLTMRSPQESAAVMKRNFLNQIFDGCGVQYHDPSDQYAKRPYGFDDPFVLRAICESRRAMAKIGPVPEVSGNETAVVYSERERLRRDGAKKYSRLTGEMYYSFPQDLNRVGMAYDLVTLEDYLAAKTKWRNVIFVNVFYLTDEERVLLKRKVESETVNAVWIGAPGSVTDGGFSDEAMSGLTGIALAGSGKEPAVVSRDAGARLREDGGIEKVAGAKRSVVYPHPPSGWGKIRAAMDEFGIRLDAPGGNYFRRHGDVFMYHVANKGEYELKVPDLGEGDKIVELFSGRVIESAPFKQQSTGPDTCLYKILRKAK